jgi:homoserine O-acetyltransferase
MPHTFACRAAAMLLGALLALPAFAQTADPLQRRDGDFVLKDFRFHTGEQAAVKIHYTTLGNPRGAPVLLLHGTNGNGAGMIAGFAPLFEPGAPLDAATHYIILPDALGSGGSAKPSDGLKAKFPRYNYDDMVQAQYRLVTEALGVKHLRLVIGNSMGGMHVWVWGVKYPAMMDGLMPMASQPTAMAGRNWMMRRLLIESIKADPGYQDGNYTQQPRAVRSAQAMFDAATSGGTLALSAAAPTAAAADAWVDQRLATARNDANDVIWQFDAAHDYDPSPGLDRIAAPVLAVNAADDERNPVETGLMVRAMARLPSGRLYVVPAGPATRGHATTGNVTLWQDQLTAFLSTLQRR